MAVHQQRFWKTNPFTDERFIIFNWSFTTYHPLCHLINSKASNVWGFPVKGNVYILLWAVKKLSREIKKYHLWWRCLNINAVKSYYSSVPSRHMERLSSSVIFDSTFSRKAHTHFCPLLRCPVLQCVFGHIVRSDHITRCSETGY